MYCGQTCCRHQVHVYGAETARMQEVGMTKANEWSKVASEPQPYDARTHFLTDDGLTADLSVISWVVQQNGA